MAPYLIRPNVLPLGRYGSFSGGPEGRAIQRGGDTHRSARARLGLATWLDLLTRTRRFLSGVGFSIFRIGKDFLVQLQLTDQPLNLLRPNGTSDNQLEA